MGGLFGGNVNGVMFVESFTRFVEGHMCWGVDCGVVTVVFF